MYFSKASGPALQPSQHSIQQISGSFFGGKAAGKWSWTLTFKCPG